MKIACIVYDGVTTLDFAGAYDPVTQLKTMGFVPDLAYDVCARTETVRSFERVRIIPDRGSPDLRAYDYIVIPGGDGVKELIRDREFWAGWRGDSVPRSPQRCAGERCLPGRRACSATSGQRPIRTFCRS